MHKRIRSWKQLLYQLILLAVGLFVLLPMIGMLRLAFDGSIIVAPTDFRLVPKEFTLSVFKQVWLHPSQSLTFLQLLGNSLYVSGGAAILSILLGATMAYAFARYRFPGRKQGLLFLLLGTLLPPVALMTPLFILLTALKLRTSLFGLMLVYTSFTLPFCIWNMRAAFQTVAKELDESALLDGDTPWISFWRVHLPLSLPAILVAALVAFLAGYSEFAIGWLFVQRSTNVTLAMAMIAAFDTSGVSWSAMSAMAILMSLPVVIIFLVLKQYLLDRLLIAGFTD